MKFLPSIIVLLIINYTIILPIKNDFIIDKIYIINKNILSTKVVS